MTQRQTVYSMLRRAHKDGVTNGAFAEAGILRYSARIEELRREGHAIVKQRVIARCWKYTLLPGVIQTIPPAVPSGDARDLQDRLDDAQARLKATADDALEMPQLTIDQELGRAA